MSKGDNTRQMIIEKSASLFNTQGFAGTSWSHIMKATSLEKGGIYNHFKSKEDIALTAFDYIFARLDTLMSEAVAGVDSPIDRLIIFIKFFGVYRDDDIIAGGCPIMNTIIDADDGKLGGHSALREKALHALSVWQRVIERRLEKAIIAGEAKPDTDIQGFASLVISSLEGAVMLSRIHDDFSHLDRVVKHLLDVIEKDIRV